MTQYDEGLIRMVDARIARATRRYDAFGTVTSRATTGPGATVTFDGSTVAVECKVFGHVHAFEGDRVALTLVETTWCVTGTFARRQLAEGAARVVGTDPATAITTATYVDMPGPAQLTYNKRYDGTSTRINMSTTLWASVADTDAQIGVRIAGVAGTETASTFTPLEVSIANIQLDSAFIRATLIGTQRRQIPAGDYTITGRWRRTNGTGEIRQDNRDVTTIEVDEVFRTASN